MFHQLSHNRKQIPVNSSTIKRQLDAHNGVQHAFILTWTPFTPTPRCYGTCLQRPNCLLCAGSSGMWVPQHPNNEEPRWSWTELEGSMTVILVSVFFYWSTSCLLIYILYDMYIIVWYSQFLYFFKCFCWLYITTYTQFVQTLWPFGSLSCCAEKSVFEWRESEKDL